MRGFFRSIEPYSDQHAKRAEAITNRDLERGNIALWQDEDHNVVSMAAKVRETENGASISYVYTPAKYRGRGHAGRVVAWLSQRLLNTGKIMCNLYTDLANPTSNRIYKKLGYQLIAESAEISFGEPKKISGQPLKSQLRL